MGEGRLGVVTGVYGLALVPDVYDIPSRGADANQMHNPPLALTLMLPLWRMPLASLRPHT